MSNCTPTSSLVARVTASFLFFSFLFFKLSLLLCSQLVQPLLSLPVWDKRSLLCTWTSKVHCQQICYAQFKKKIFFWTSRRISFSDLGFRISHGLRWDNHPKGSNPKVPLGLVLPEDESEQYFSLCTEFLWITLYFCFHCYCWCESPKLVLFTLGLFFQAQWDIFIPIKAEAFQHGPCSTL